MKLEYNGLIKVGDSSRCSSDEDELLGSIWVGDRDLVDDVYEHKWGPNVRMLVDDKVIGHGPCVVELGYGYSEFTPLEDDTLKLGGVDVIHVLRGYDGQLVKVVVTDE